jgi:formylglycine-generating enzyme required for sulfatase activity
MAYVAGTTFTQGCNAMVDNQCSSDEKPAHAVKLGSYFVGKTEVTAGQYAACVQSGGCSVPAKQGSGDATYGVPNKEQFPVNYVSWGQAVAFCTWAGGERLCTEAEWEFAARGTDSRRYPWGNSAPTCEQANFSGCAKLGAQAVGASAKGSSPVGALDMAGNVREWVSDWYAAAWYGEAAKTNPAGNPQGPTTGTSRVLRGGYFMDSGPGLRTSARSFAAPGTGSASVGIRCCKAP